jgi:Alginate lyase.
MPSLRKIKTPVVARIGLTVAVLGALFGGEATTYAADLMPPPGYFSAVGDKGSKKDADRCPTPPTPYTGSLQFTSKYKGSDSARSTLNADAEKEFRSQIKDITDMERGATKLITQYMRSGNKGDLDCAMNWLDSWAKAGALESSDYNHTGKSMRKWALGSLSSSYMRLKFSSSRPLASYTEQSREIENWFSTLGSQVVRDWSDLPLKKINNHSYWAAWSVMSTAVVTNRRDLFDWSVQEFKVAANQVDNDGYLPNELKRRQRALSYHNYSLPPLTMIAAFAQVNGVDLRQENNGALQRLANRVMQGVDDQDAFDEKTGNDQDMGDLKENSKFAWLEPYCALYSCAPKTQDWKKKMEPFNSFRLGGEVTKVFNRQGAGS